MVISVVKKTQFRVVIRAVRKRNLWLVIRMVKTDSFGWLLVSIKKKHILG